MKFATQVTVDCESLEDEFAKILSQEIAKEIDGEILFKIYKMYGWQQVTLETLESVKKSIDVQDWLHANCKSKFFQNGRHFIFEDKNDALMFILSWK